MLYVKIFFAAAFVIAAQTAISAQCLSGDCVNGQGVFKYPSGATYEGKWVNDKREGKGIFRSADGDIYEGSYVNDNKEGQGTYIWKSGTKYVGAFKNGKRGGFGIETLASGDVYEGNYVNDEKEGQGKYTLKNGSFYIGEYKNGKRHGQGKFYNKPYNTYQEGRWQNGDYIAGSSSNPVPNNTLAPAQPGDGFGCVSGNCVNGEGLFKFSHGDVYQGSFVNSKMEGKGTYIWKNGDKYIGTFKGAKRNGFGIFYRAGGDVYEGNYVDDKREGRGKNTSPNGSFYDGEYKNGERHGQGEFHNKEKNVIVRGLWQEGGYIPGTNEVLNRKIAEAKAEAEADAADRADPNKIRSAISEYNRIHPEIEALARRYVNDINKYRRAGDAQFLYKETYADILRTKRIASETIRKFMEAHGKYLPEDLKQHLEEDGAKFVDAPNY